MLGDDARHFLVDDAGAFIAERLGEAVFAAGGIVVGEVGQTLAHAVVCDHGVSHLGGTLKVVESTGVSKPKEHLLCHTTGKHRSHVCNRHLYFLHLESGLRSDYRNLLLLGKTGHNHFIQVVGCFFQHKILSGRCYF